MKHASHKSSRPQLQIEEMSAEHLFLSYFFTTKLTWSSARELDDFVASWENALLQCRSKLKDSDYEKASRFSTPDKLLDDIKQRKSLKPWLSQALSDVRPTVRMIQNTSSIFLTSMQPKKIEIGMIYLLIYLIIEVGLFHGEIMSQCLSTECSFRSTRRSDGLRYRQC